jgi:hypothetical protein
MQIGAGGLAAATGLTGATRHAFAQADARPWSVLADAQARWLAAACDVFIPEDDFPSASQAGVVDFIDFQLATDYGRGAGLYLEGPFPEGATETQTFRNNRDQTALPIRRWGSYLPGVGVGGAGVHWNGQTFRFLPSDFVAKSHNEERYGAAARGDDGPGLRRDLRRARAAFRPLREALRHRRARPATSGQIRRAAIPSRAGAATSIPIRRWR